MEALYALKAANPVWGSGVPGIRAFPLFPPGQLFLGRGTVTCFVAAFLPRLACAPFRA